MAVEEHWWWRQDHVWWSRVTWWETTEQPYAKVRNWNRFANNLTTNALFGEKTLTEMLSQKKLFYQWRPFTTKASDCSSRVCSHSKSGKAFPQCSCASDKSTCYGAKREPDWIPRKRTSRKSTARDCKLIRYWGNTLLGKGLDQIET